jgi:hypothetical protein
VADVARPRGIDDDLSSGFTKAEKTTSLALVPLTVRTSAWETPKSFFIASRVLDSTISMFLVPW